MDKTMTLNGCAAGNDADATVFSTVFRGVDTGPKMREASMHIETYSPYQREDLADLRVRDAGSIELPSDLMQACDTIEAYVGSTLGVGSLPVMVSSNHALAFGAIRAAAGRFPDLRVIHIGAAAEMKRDADSGLSTMRRVWELLGDQKIFQFGIRSGSREEFEWAVPPHVRMERFSARSIDSAADMSHNLPVYITIDMSVIDPSEFCAQLAPNCGGITFNRLHDALMSLRGLDIVGFDVCGYAPDLDAPNMSSAAMIFKLMREMLVAFI